jgi:staphylococcal nuclease domain-containing protein 1
MGRRPPNPTVVAEVEGTAEETTNGDDSVEAPAPLTTAQRLAASAFSTEIPPDRNGREAKHFTETRVLNRDVSHLWFQKYYLICVVNIYHLSSVICLYFF